VGGSLPDDCSREEQLGLFSKIFGNGGESAPGGEPAEPPRDNEPRFLRDALHHAFQEQVAKVASIRGVGEFAEAYLMDEGLAERVVAIAEENMRLTLADDEGYSVTTRERDIIMLTVETVPVNSRSAPDWFSDRYGGYVTFQSKVVDDPRFAGEGYKVFIHVVFGVEKRDHGGVFYPWVGLGIMPCWGPSLVEWVAPRTCCNESDRQLIGI
jgi:hypothetical protein